MDDGMRLAHAMQIDRASLMAMQVLFRQGGQQDHASGDEAKFYECVNSVDKSLFTDVYGEAFSKGMTSEEIDAAVRFFESAVGRKYIERDIAFIPYGLGFPSQATMPKVKLSAEEQRSADEFFRTQAGVKSGSIPMGAQTLHALHLKWEGAVEKCREGLGTPVKP